MVPFRFLDRSLTGVRSPGLRRAVPSHAQLKQPACLFIRQGLPVPQQVQDVKTEHGLSCGAHFRGARCQSSISSKGIIIACTTHALRRSSR
ncbi:hypothetical protein ACRWEJ_26090 [Escherichia coli]